MIVTTKRGQYQLGVVYLSESWKLLKIYPVQAVFNPVMILHLLLLQLQALLEPVIVLLEQLGNRESPPTAPSPSASPHSQPPGPW